MKKFLLGLIALFFLATPAMADGLWTCRYNLVTPAYTLDNQGIYPGCNFATNVGHSIVLDVPVGTGIYAAYDGTLANVTVTVSYR
jgi:hypothetical protein